MDLIAALGRKAKARLQEERDKRPEIVRLSAEEQANLEIDRLCEEAPPATVPTRKKKPASRKKAPAKRKRVSHEDDETMDRWMPSVEHFPSHQDPSRWVQLHGMPLGIAATHLRTFFSGLDPQCILLFPISIDPSLRANHALPLRKGPGQVERYASDELQVWVQFFSIPTANAALARSGESVSVEEPCALRITSVPKSIARPQISLSFPVEMDNRMPLYECLELVKERIPPQVLQILLNEKKKQSACTDANVRALHRILGPAARVDPTLRASDPVLSLTWAALEKIQNVESGGTLTTLEHLRGSCFDMY